MDIHQVRKIINATAVLATVVGMDKIGPSVHKALESYFGVVPAIPKADDFRKEAISRWSYADGQKIPAIKWIRERVPGMGLKEAKDWVEANIPGFEYKPY